MSNGGSRYLENGFQFKINISLFIWTELTLPAITNVPADAKAILCDDN